MDMKSLGAWEKKVWSWCVSAFLPYIFTMWRYVKVSVYAMQQYNFTLTISTHMSQELWIREICTDQLVHVAYRKVCAERSIPLLGINVLIMTMIKSPQKVTTLKSPQ
jgi:hypothetical protein